MYDESADPWSLAERWYESRKYAITLASLPKRRYRRAFEPGCSVGVLTKLLAERCDELLAVDVAPAALATAAARTAACPGVSVEPMAVPGQWPAGEFDLVVLSEVGYYLGAADLTVLVDRTISSLEPGGAVVAVHWRHPVEDYPLRGDEVHAVIAADSRLERLVRHTEADFLLDVFVRPPSQSVAAAEGLVS